MSAHPDTLAQRERGLLCDAMLRSGPDAPTLCAGWTTADLAAHLVVRERRPDAAIGAWLEPFNGRLQRAMEQAKAHGFPSLVGEVRGGPPALLRGLDSAMNTSEFFIHHEDVRRAQPDWEPRELSQADTDELWRTAKQLARMALVRRAGGVVYVVPGGPRAKVAAGQPVTVVTGQPGELLLWTAGRAEHARATVR